MNGTIFLLLIILAMLGVYVGWIAKYDAGEFWHRWPEVKPRAYHDIRNYPVALYDAEIGVIIDFCEYHPFDIEPWRMVGDGYPAHPLAWFDLPGLPRDILDTINSADIGIER